MALLLVNNDGATRHSNLHPKGFQVIVIQIRLESCGIYAAESTKEIPNGGTYKV